MLSTSFVLFLTWTAFLAGFLFGVLWAGRGRSMDDSE